MREYKHKLMERTPEEIHVLPEFKALLKIVEKENLNDKADVLSYLVIEITKQDNLLKTARGSSTSNRLRAKYSEWADTLRRIKSLVNKYVKE